MGEDTIGQLRPFKRIAPPLAGFTLGYLAFFPRLAARDNGPGASWLFVHSLCGPFEKVIYTESIGLSHTDLFFGAILLFMMSSHLFSMRRPTVILGVVGAFLWVAAAVGHYG